MPWAVLLDALVDTLKIFPFLLLVFILIAVFENKVSSKKYARLLGGRFAPLVGSVTGVIPQCGFSVMAVKFFQEHCITIGTMLAIFISTSDEAVIVLLSNGMWKEFLMLVGVKMVVAIIVGYAADFLWKGVDLYDSEGEEFNHDCHHHCGNSNFDKYFIHPLLHCLKTALYVLIINVVLGLIIFWVGEDSFSNFMANTGFLQPFVASLVGLIPNCASSVVIVQVFVSGNLTFSGLVAGLITNAGVGIALLFKEHKKVVRNVIVIAILYVAGVLTGEIIALISSLI